MVFEKNLLLPLKLGCQVSKEKLSKLSTQHVGELISICAISFVWYEFVFRVCKRKLLEEVEGVRCSVVGSYHYTSSYGYFISLGTQFCNKQAIYFPSYLCQQKGWPAATKNKEEAEKEKRRKSFSSFEVNYKNNIEHTNCLNLMTTSFWLKRSKIEALFHYSFYNIFNACDVMANVFFTSDATTGVACFCEKGSIVVVM